MKLLKKWRLLTLLLANTVTLNACGNSNAKNNQTAANDNTQQKVETTQQSDIISTSKIQAELDNAKKVGKAVFVVVTGTGSTNTDEAIEIAKGANAIYKNAIILQMDRDDAANVQLSRDWRLSGAPVPLILVLSTKGLLAGGFILNQATAEKIAALVPTPKMEEVYVAIGSSKHAVVVFTKKSFTDRTEVIKNSKIAVAVLNNEAVFVEVDMDDPAETGFMDQLRINKATNASTTLVINKQGQVAGTSTTIPDVEKLVAAAKTPVRKGCGPGCGPAGCGKK